MTTVAFRSKNSAIELVASLKRDEHTPLSAMIEIADRCNETCVHCYQVQGQKGELATDDWRKIIDELAELGVVFLTISGGEATLRRDFLDLVAHARRRRFAVKLYTNGLSMNDELAGKLAELAVQEVQISLYSHLAERHDAVTCVPGSFERTVRGARALVAAGVKLVLKTPLMKLNADEIDEYVAFVTALGADYSLDPHVDPREDGDRTPEAFRIDDAAFKRAKSHPLLAPRTDLGEGPPRRNLDKPACGACSGHVHIEANGEMRPCTQLTVPVGHAVEDGVKRSYRENDTALAIRSIAWRDLVGCRECDLRDYCGRCFANAIVEAGDALAPYPSACRAARLQYEVMHGEPVEIRATHLVPPPADVSSAPSGADLGPYRDVGGGVFETFRAEPTPEDIERRARHAWSRPEAPLVQIRRPSVRGPRGRGPASPPATNAKLPIEPPRAPRQTEPA